jgi:suppressor of fused-like protein
MAIAGDETTAGWDAITAALERLYGEQEPMHYGTAVPWGLGGPDPLDGVSVYRAGSGAQAHWHYVTYGFSELYAKESDDVAVSGYGFELTMRLHGAGAEGPTWPIHLLQNLARYVFDSGRVLAAGDHMDANGPIAAEEKTALTALLFAADPALRPIATLHGALTFVQLVGITADELDAARAWNTDGVLGLLRARSPHLVTDLARPSVLDADARRVVEAGIARDGSSMGVLFANGVRIERAGGALVMHLTTLAVEHLTRVPPAGCCTAGR